MQDRKAASREPAAFGSQALSRISCITVSSVDRVEIHDPSGEIGSFFISPNWSSRQLTHGFVISVEMLTTAPREEIDQILRAEHRDPFHILGAHLVRLKGKSAVAVRAFLPEAQDARAVAMDLSKNQVMTRIRPEGFFEAVFPGVRQLFRYRLQITDASGHVREFGDRYSFWLIV